MTFPVSTPSGLKSAADLWVEAAERLMGDAPGGRRTNEPAYYDTVYANDRPAWRPLAARDQSGCALSVISYAREVGVLHCDDLILRPYEGHNDAVTIVEEIYRRHGALLYHHAFPRDEIFLERGFAVRVGWSKPQRSAYRSDLEFTSAVNSWLSEWGGDEHVLLVTEVEGMLPYTIRSIDGGQPGVCRIERTLSWDGRGRPWLTNRQGRAKRIASVGDCSKVELSPKEQEQ